MTTLSSRTPAREARAGKPLRSSSPSPSPPHKNRRIADPANTPSGRRSYNVYIMYSPYYRTPRLYLSGYLPTGQPLPPSASMDDIVGDYKDKTVTLEDFPFFNTTLKMASVHPCKHAPVMKTLLDRADAALRIKREKLRGEADVGDVVGEMERLDVKGVGEAADKGEEWEEVQQTDIDEQEVAIRVDQYLVVFLKVSPVDAVS